MPILEDATGAGELQQGDVLGGVTLHGTDLVKGSAFRVQSRTHCLVISRDCVALRDPQVVVAAVARFNATPEIDDEDDVREFFEEIREGVLEPDTFYLGSLPGGPERFVARLDELCIAKLPSDPTERAAWIAQHRVARLSTDFIRALPVRLFTTFGRVGYDDHKWYSTPDLEWLVLKTRAAIAKSKADLAKAEADLAESQAVAGTNRGRAESQDREIRRLRDVVNDSEAKLKPFEEEFKSRAK